MHYIIMHYNDLMTNMSVRVRIYLLGKTVTRRYLVSAITLQSGSLDMPEQINLDFAISA